MLLSSEDVINIYLEIVNGEAAPKNEPEDHRIFRAKVAEEVRQLKKLNMTLEIPSDDLRE
jgi:hypothetical protein